MSRPFTSGNPISYLWAEWGRGLEVGILFPSKSPFQRTLALAASGVWAAPATVWLSGELQPHAAGLAKSASAWGQGKV